MRENAARLFFDVFPVQNPDLSKEDSQQLLQKQFDLFTVGFIRFAVFKESFDIFVVPACDERDTLATTALRCCASIHLAVCPDYNFYIYGWISK